MDVIARDVLAQSEELLALPTTLRTRHQPTVTSVQERTIDRSNPWEHDNIARCSEFSRHPEKSERETCRNTHRFALIPAAATVEPLDAT